MCRKKPISRAKGDKWQDIAAANNIENPRLLQPGQLLDMNASLSGGGSFGASASLTGVHRLAPESRPVRAWARPAFR